MVLELVNTDLITLIIRTGLDRSPRIIYCGLPASPSMRWSDGALRQNFPPHLLYCIVQWRGFFQPLGITEQCKTGK